jgi:hypothetical protein
MPDPASGYLPFGQVAGAHKDGLLMSLPVAKPVRHVSHASVYFTVLQVAHDE